MFDKRTTGDEQFDVVTLFYSKIYYEAFLHEAAAVHAIQQMMTNGKHILGKRQYSEEYYYITQEVSAESDKEPFQ